MKILVLTEDYPNNHGGVALMYVHTRNIYYHEHGIDVDNLSFSAAESYNIDGICVLSLSDYLQEKKNYDLLIIHAANIRHHYMFLKKYGHRFKYFMFFFHGHEVLKIHSVYSKPYPFVRENKIKIIAQNTYDFVKLKIWRYYFPKVISKSFFVFVSKWMLEEFEKWTGINRSMLDKHYSITYNCVGKEFEDACYDSSGEKPYDFVTIRGNLDGSKYSIDIVNKLAKVTPQGRFLVIGKGKFFSYYKKADNLEWWNKTLSHDEIIHVLNQSKFALMPTRTDAQGLMMCEMAAFGIPVVTSDIPVCHEVFDGFSNVYYISNMHIQSLQKLITAEHITKKDTRYYCENTVQKEYELIRSFERKF